MPFPVPLKTTVERHFLEKSSHAIPALPHAAGIVRDKPRKLFTLLLLLLLPHTAYNVVGGVVCPLAGAGNINNRQLLRARGNGAD